MTAGYGKQSIADDELFKTIVDHRKTVNPLRGIDYSNHKKGKLNIIPPDEVLSQWEEDYKTMQENMIVGDSLNWDELLQRIKHIQNLFNENKVK